MHHLNPVTLDELQSRVQSCILGAGHDTGALLPLLCHDAGGLPGAQRIAIYHSAYRSRLREVLGTVFEHTRAYLGDEPFDTLCARQIATTPSRSRNLRDYGAGFPQLVRDARPDAPDAAELATIDWNLHRAFDAPDLPLLNAGHLAMHTESDWADRRLMLHPGTALAVFEWNTVDLWHALAQCTPPPRASRLAQPQPYLFWRSALRARFRSLEHAEYQMLDALQAGVDFASACERLARETPDAVERAGGWLARWLVDELLCERAPDRND
ncbi:MAG: putative DNA-binding domain-containing protein [Rhodocyclaceae bacterium]|nr:putative DNA-binding domain-containing protein [Rhodocyclaceae bacterium]